MLKNNKRILITNLISIYFRCDLSIRFADLYQQKKTKILIDIHSQNCKVHFACVVLRSWLHSQYSTVHTWQCEIVKCQIKTRKWQKAWLEKRRKIKKGHGETRESYSRIKAMVFSRTVNKILSGDQIDRLVLSARKNSASGLLCFLFVDTGRRLLHIFTVIRDASASYLVISTVYRWSPRYGKTPFCKDIARQDDVTSIFL